MSETNKLSLSIQLRRGTAAEWMQTTRILENGEPGYEYDTGKLKIGNGKSLWKDLVYIGSDNFYFVKQYSDLPKEGNENYVYKVEEEKKLYQWNSTDFKYEPLNNEDSFNPNDIKIIYGGKSNV